MPRPIFITTAFGGWKDCVEMRFGATRLIATTAVGPRLIYLSVDGGDNLFKNYPDQMGSTGGQAWRIYGGHRLWHAPEAVPRTYVPDNDPVEWRIENDSLLLEARTESTTAIQKSIVVSAGEHENEIHVLHRLRNRGEWTVEAAVWALSVMAPGGSAVLPQEGFAPHPDALSPARPLVLWPYTKMQDPRWTWGDRQVVLRQDAHGGGPQKIGALNTAGWVAYFNDKYLFLKCFDADPGAPHVDFGCNTELFTNEEMLEVETLSRLHRIEPGQTVTHLERWHVWSLPVDPGSVAWATGRDLDALLEVLPA